MQQSVHRINIITLYNGDISLSMKELITCPTQWNNLIIVLRCKYNLTPSQSICYKVLLRLYHKFEIDSIVYTCIQVS